MSNTNSGQKSFKIIIDIKFILSTFIKKIVRIKKVKILLLN